MGWRTVFAAVILSVAAMRGAAQPWLPFVVPLAGGILHLGNQINTDYREGSPVLSLDGQVLLFSRQGHPQNFGLTDAEDIWMSFRQPDGTWSRAINAGAPLNDLEENRPAVYYPTRNCLYFTRTEPTDTSFSAYRLFRSIQQGRTWSTPTPVIIPGYRNHHPDSYFFPGPDDRFILFSADGAGQRDLFISMQQPDGTWGAPQSLGSAVNTAGDERQAVLATDERTLYFSSTGLGGHGGSDIFVSRRLGESWTEWTKPVNLGPVINSQDDDDQFSLAAAGNFLLTARRVDEDKWDLFQAILPQALRPLPVILIRGIVSGAGRQDQLYAMPLDGSARAPSPVSLRMGSRFRLVIPASTPAVSIWMVNEAGFTQSACLALAGEPPGGLDTVCQSVLTALYGDPQYAQRESEIQLLRQEWKKNERDLDLLTARIRADTMLDESALPGFPGESGLTATIEEKYRAFFSALPADTVAAEDATPPAAGSVAWLSSQVDTGAVRTPASFTGAVWRQLLADLLPVVRREAAVEAVQVELAGLSAAKRVDAFRQSFLEDRLARLRNDSLFTKPMPPPAADGPSWLGAMEQEMRSALYDTARHSLAVLLRPLVVAAQEDELRYYRRTLHRANLRQELDNKLQRQMDQERKAEARSDAGTFTLGQPPATGSNPPENFREVEVTLNIRPVEAGQTVTLYNVFFAGNATDLLPPSTLELERLAGFLIRRPDLGIDLTAHTHGQICHDQAQRLTQARAETVAAFLVSRGVNPNRIFARGAGKLDPVSDNFYPSGRRQNQRLEIRWINLQDRMP